MTFAVLRRHHIFHQQLHRRLELGVIFLGQGPIVKSGIVLVGKVHLHIRGQPYPLQVFTFGGEVAAYGQIYGRAILQLEEILVVALAYGVGADGGGRTVFVEDCGDELSS